MLRIVEVHISSSPNGEYIVLQNQGITTINLRGWAVCGDSYLHGDPAAAADRMFVFSEPALIRPYTRVVLFSGDGADGWEPTNDGKRAYVVYWRRREPAWADTVSVHLLQSVGSRRVAGPAEVEPRPPSPADRLVEPSIPPEPGGLPVDSCGRRSVRFPHSG